MCGYHPLCNSDICFMTTTFKSKPYSRKCKSKYDGMQSRRRIAYFVYRCNVDLDEDRGRPGNYPTLPYLFQTCFAQQLFLLSIFQYLVKKFYPYFGWNSFPTWTCENYTLGSINISVLLYVCYGLISVFNNKYIQQISSSTMR